MERLGARSFGHSRVGTIHRFFAIPNVNLTNCRLDHVFKENEDKENKEEKIKTYDSSNRTLLEHHQILGKCTSFIREHILNLPQTKKTKQKNAQSKPVIMT